MYIIGRNICFLSDGLRAGHLSVETYDFLLLLSDDFQEGSGLTYYSMAFGWNRSKILLGDIWTSQVS